MDLNPDIICKLKERVARHNRLGKGRHVLFSEVKKCFGQYANGPTPEGTGFQKLDEWLGRIALEPPCSIHPAVPALQLSMKYFHRPDDEAEIIAICRLVRNYKSGTESGTTGKPHRKTLVSIEKHALALERELARLDIRTRLGLIGAIVLDGAVTPATAADIAAAERAEAEGIEIPQMGARSAIAPLRVQKIGEFFEILNRLKETMALADGTYSVPRGHPETPDHLRLGVQLLHGLWLSAVPMAKTGGHKQGSFVELAREVLAKPCGYSDANVRTAVRQHREAVARDLINPHQA